MTAPTSLNTLKAVRLTTLNVSSDDKAVNVTALVFLRLLNDLVPIHHKLNGSLTTSMPGIDASFYMCFIDT